MSEAGHSTNMSATHGIIAGLVHGQLAIRGPQAMMSGVGQSADMSVTHSIVADLDLSPAAIARDRMTVAGTDFWRAEEQVLYRRTELRKHGLATTPLRT